MKKLNKYLVENHPQIWNTKLFWAGGILLLIHVIFYLAGYARFDSYERLHTYLRSDIHVTDGYSMSFSMLISILFIIIWLVFYLRNNPFKSYYPLRKGYFFTEFCIQFAVLLAAITFYKSYANGFWKAIENKTANVKLAEEINTMNLSYALIPVENKYCIRDCCDSLDYIFRLDSAISDTSIDRLLRKKLRADRDSFYRNHAYDRKVSYLNYCGQYSSTFDDSTLNRYKISGTINRWLSGGRKDSVKQTLSRFRDMCKKYKIDYNIFIESYADTVFARKDFSFSTYVSTYGGEYNGVVENTVIDIDTDENEEDYRYRHKSRSIAGVRIRADYYEKARLDFPAINNVLDAIHISRTRTFDLIFWLVNLSVVFCMCLALYTFRLTHIRTWFIALVAGGVTVVACSIYAILLDNEGVAYSTFIALILFFYLSHWIFRSMGRKLLTGVMLMWFTWCLPLLLTFIYAYLCIYFRPQSRLLPDNTWYTEPPTPFYQFLTHQEVVIYLGAFILCFFSVSLWLYRHYRQWQAMPEE